MTQPQSLQSVVCWFVIFALTHNALPLTAQVRGPVLQRTNDFMTFVDTGPGSFHWGDSTFSLNVRTEYTDSQVGYFRDGSTRSYLIRESRTEFECKQGYVRVLGTDFYKMNKGGNSVGGGGEGSRTYDASWGAPHDTITALALREACSFISVRMPSLGKIPAWLTPSHIRRIKAADRSVYEIARLGENVAKGFDLHPNNIFIRGQPEEYLGMRYGAWLDRHIARQTGAECRPGAPGALVCTYVVTDLGYGLLEPLRAEFIQVGVRFEHSVAVAIVARYRRGIIRGAGKEDLDGATSGVLRILYGEPAIHSQGTEMLSKWVTPTSSVERLSSKTSYDVPVSWSWFRRKSVVPSKKVAK